jgi:hypothetical protein
VDDESKKNFGCAKATNFELEIEDRGHLADMRRFNQRSGGIRRTCVLLMMGYSSLQLLTTCPCQLEPDESESGAGRGEPVRMYARSSSPSPCYAKILVFSAKLLASLQPSTVYPNMEKTDNPIPSARALARISLHHMLSQRVLEVL